MANDKGFGQGDPALARWAERTFHPEDALLADVRQRSQAAGLPPIAVGTMDGLHLEVIARAAGAKKAIEIGTLGGYSGVCILRGLGDGGTLDTFEYEPRHAEVARATFAKAGFAERVRIHVGRAVDNLRHVEAAGPYDLVFIDADKTSYPAYLEWAERNLKVGGIVLCDNAFGWGGVANPDGYRGDNQAGVRALAETSARLGSSDRWRATMIPTAEGLAFAVKLK